jgi:hypothetical protein
MNKLKYWISEFNKAVAIKSVVIMSTMACVFAFLIWSLLPLFFPNITDIVAYISADIIQLVALPLIMVGQKIAADNSAENHALLADRHDAIAETHDDIKEQLDLINKKLDILINK